ncbi:histidine phosphatase family protein [Nocardioides zeae]|uniref:Histidine phosphatase family protein n=1 Tax=Nocardioides imazamoxiresistens TaxID=3231893 RepID=A0ABU3PYX9_9ACTN|nr:histidine phosphatase family protein [Nocardioides zeae]MDT9594467.1 histidine phosphatase family protein [Nocardioides zeae]
MALLLVRHGETEWSRSGRHTSVTDLPLTSVGEDQARALASRLADYDPVLTLVSPRHRARRTAELAGARDARVDERLVEWAYGDAEGRTTLEVREDVPGWTVWNGPVPGGEEAADVGRRCDDLLASVTELVDVAEHDVLLIAHAHVLRVLAARWLGLPAVDGRLLRLDTARLSVLGHERDQPVLLRWNA